MLVAVTAILEPRFLEAASLRNLALNASIFAILAVGQTLVLVTRNVDLSVGSVLGLSAYFAGDLLSNHPGLPMPVVFVLGMALGAACGAVQRRPRHLGAGAGAGGDAGDAVHVPRARVPVDQRHARSTPRRCRTRS